MSDFDVVTGPAPSLAPPKPRDPTPKPEAARAGKPGDEHSGASEPEKAAAGPPSPSTA